MVALALGLFDVSRGQERRDGIASVRDKQILVHILVKITPTPVPIQSQTPDLVGRG